ncbi:Potassium voltage-gated channel subfamily KQT; possible potassium channel, VIC family [hydrothermal vent metagenome]|uniref:Potassium voltage-gated channel subfamily KQT possible potassium channel, VIC family n=1 Tax=hydrothermal vent metagenome TaxID=652676 RepID=A0A3B1BBP9_9ZZZZ
MIISHLLKRRWTQRRYGKYTRHYTPDFSVRLLKLVALLFVLVLINTAGMMFFERQSLGDALWMGVTTITTVGYGDISPSTTGGRLITVIFLYALGISILAHVVTEFIEHKLWVSAEKKHGRWRWNMKDHILIINTPAIDSDNYLRKLVQQIRMTPVLSEYPVQILTDKFSELLPKDIAALGIVHFSGNAENSENLRAVNVSDAKYIIVIASDHADPPSDSLTFDVLDRIQEIGSNAMVLAEAINDDNRKRLQRAGANIVVRPIRAYPGFLVRSLVAPGTEEVLEDLFTHDNAHMQRFDLRFQDQCWQELICRFVTSGAGIPMAYVADGEVICNPKPTAVCSGDAIITLLNDGQTVTEQQVKACLN